MAETAAETADLQAALEALRASGVAERNPVRFAYLKALARRAAAQSEPIRQSLNAKIIDAAHELADRPVNSLPEAPPASTASPLTDLLAYIGQRAHEQPEALETAAVNRNFGQISKSSSADRSPQTPELKSVAYFRDEWSKLSTEQQLTQTLAQAPENAGPMNSQHLVLRSLQVMRDISPDYLQGFMSYIDTLIWLEHAAQTKPATARSSGGDGQAKKRTEKRSVTNR